MFAPPVTKAYSKTAAASSNSPGHQLLKPVANRSRHCVIDQTNTPDYDQDRHEAGPAGRDAPSASWDFGKLPIFSPDRLSWFQTRSPLAELPMRGVIQPKLVVGAIDDPLEREADAVADQVMRMPDPALSITHAPPQINRKCAACEEEENVQKLQTKPAGVARPVGEVPPIVHEVLRSPGQPLDQATRDFFEPRFGRDFADIRIHDDARAARSALEVGAFAYTVGRRIVVDPARYHPGTIEGRRLLAHELAHVAQQVSNSADGVHIRRQSETSHPSKAEEAAGARLRALAARPRQALGQWRKLQAAEQSFIVMTMVGSYGADFAQEFLDYAQGRKKPDLSTEVTNRETPQALTARGFRFAGDPGGVPLWVHPSGHEVLLLSPGKKPPPQPECDAICADVDSDSCDDCCDERIPGSSDDDVHCNQACKVACATRLD